MTLNEFLAELRKLPDAVLHPGASELAIESLELRYGIRLPTIHRELLLRTNGIDAAGGYLRLYGVGPDAAVDMGTWNEPELWKFSWQPFVAGLFSFGGTCWGDQFVYRFADLFAHRPDAPMHMLMEGQTGLRRSTQTFEQYLYQGFLANAREQLAPFNRKVRKKVGDLAPGELLTLAPHPLIGGPERVGNVMKMPAAMVMVIDGDMLREFLKASEATGGDPEVTGVVPYADDKGRMRIRLTYQRAGPE